MLAHALVLLHFLALVQAANWNTDVRVLVTERLDPIISPNAVASHMHSILGGSAFGAAYNQPDLMKSSCTSFPISIDKSNYWHPKPYWINGNGSSFTPLPISNRVYYIREKNSPNDWIRPFPEGLRMIVGNPNSKSADARSFQYLCRVADKFNGPGDIWSDHWNFERDCPKGILAQHKFPPCWDGVNLYKSDQSHMAFPQWGAHYGACPASHPIRLPGIMLEVYINTYRWAPGEATKGKLAWANGDTTGYGIHADFTNGWDTAILGRALNDTVCGTSQDITFQECPVFQPFINTQACSPDKGVMAESTQHVDMVPITRLPGCNPLWTSGPKPGCSSTPPDPSPAAWKGTDGPRVAAQSAIPTLPTLPGWKDISCIKDSDNMLLNKIRSYDPNVTQTTCLDSCLRSGYSYASIGYAWGNSWVCDCGTGLDPKASLYPGMCNLTCPANASQGCGGSGAHTVFYAPNNTKTTGDYTTSMGCYANPASGKVGLQTVASYNFTSWNLMTRELCGQACADRNLDWAGIRSGGICYCGSKETFNLGEGYYVNEALCADKCAGNKTQSCGYWGGLSVFNVSSSGYKPTTLNKAAGYVQCYSDNARTSLTGAQWWDGSLTPEKCQFGCKDLGYALASVFDGSMCLCGDKLNNGAVLPTSMCSKACSNNSSAYTCGGPGNGELYETSVVASQVAAFNAKRPSGWQGCYTNTANNLTADITVTESKLSVTRCVAACAELGYPWAGLQNREQCRCSKTDPRKTTKPVAANNFCSIPCNGDTSQQCGGWSYVDLYYNALTTAPSNPGVNGTDNGVPVLPGYRGCYNGSSSLSGYKWSSGQMTVETCQAGCKEIGQPLAALTGNTCSCGTTWSGGPRLTSLSCGSTCGGNPSQRCGGWPSQSSLYDTSPATLPPTPAGYQGCWTETSPKALQGFGVWSDSQSVTNCRSICTAKGFALAGLSGGKQCWCGNALGAASVQVPSSFCVAACPADKDQNCGQWNTIALWKSGDQAAGKTSVSASSSLALSSSTAGISSASRSVATSLGGSSSSSVSSSTTVSKSVTSVLTSASSVSSASRASSLSSSTAASVAPAAPSSSSLSCISDVSVLNGPKYSSSYMTQDTCVFWCRGKGHAWAGVSTNTCMCGTTRPSIQSSSCTAKCSGNTSQTCGSSTAATILSTVSLAGLVDPYTTPDPNGYLGCWTDSSTRLLPGQTFSSAQMTRSLCYAGCQARGYSIGGTQYGTQCWCSSALDSTSNNYRVTEGECRYGCGGGVGVCGGNWRMSVFGSDGQGGVVNGSSAASSAAMSSSTTTSTSVSSWVASSTSSAKSAVTTSVTVSSAATTSPVTSSLSASSSISSAKSVVPSTSTSLTSSASVASRTSTTTSSSASSPLTSSTSSPISASASASPSSAPNQTSTYLGCYPDSSPTRLLPAYNTAGPKMTSELCQSTCLGKDTTFVYFGTQFGNQCWCSPSPPDSKITKLAEGACGYSCAGDATEKCGGWAKVSVYGPVGASRPLARRRRRMGLPVGH